MNSKIELAIKEVRRPRWRLYLSLLWFRLPPWRCIECKRIYLRGGWHDSCFCSPYCRRANELKHRAIMQEVCARAGHGNAKLGRQRLLAALRESL